MGHHGSLVTSPPRGKSLATRPTRRGAESLALFQQLSPPVRLVWRPNHVGLNLHLLARHTRFRRVIPRVENENLSPTLTGPQPIEFSVHAVEPGQLGRKLLEPRLRGVETLDMFE